MKIHLLSVLIFFNILGFSQNKIIGTFPELANQQVKLIGFEGFETFAIDSTKANGNGFFSLSYSTNDFGMGYLLAENNSSFIIILEDNGILLKGSDYGVGLSVVAPGQNVYTTNVKRPDFTTLLYTGGFGGTSAAAPHVSGVAALLLSVSPDLTYIEVKDAIESTAQKIRTDGLFV